MFNKIKQETCIGFTFRKVRKIRTHFQKFDCLFLLKYPYLEIVVDKSSFSVLL